MCVCVFCSLQRGKKEKKENENKSNSNSSLSLSLSSHLDLQLRVLVRRVLPRLRQHPVVPVDVVRVEPQVALLDVLLDRVARLGRRDLHLGRGFFRDLADEVERAVGVAEGDVVPPGDGLGAGLLLGEDAEVGGGAGALWGKGRKGERERERERERGWRRRRSGGKRVSSLSLSALLLRLASGRRSLSLSFLNSLFSLLHLPLLPSRPCRKSWC